MKSEPESMKDVYDKHKEEFERHFGVRLSMFWDRYEGFQMKPFMTQVLEYDGQQPWVACVDPYGRRGRRIIHSILQDAANLWGYNYRS